MSDNLLHALGLRSFASGWPSALLLTLAAALLIVGASWWTGQLRVAVREQLRVPHQARFWATLLLLYPVWGLVQQGFVFLALWLVRGGLPAEWLPWAPVLTALFFACLHLPNFHLMFPVGFMVMIFIAHMDQHHNLAAVALAHGVLATLWRLLPPPAVSTSLNVGHWYARVQRDLQRDLEPLRGQGGRWARQPGFPWGRTE